MLLIRYRTSLSFATMTAPTRKLDDFETPIYHWFKEVILNTEQEVSILPFPRELLWSLDTSYGATKLFKDIADTYRDLTVLGYRC